MSNLYKSPCYCTNLRRSANFISDFYDLALKKVGITVAQYYLLKNLEVLNSANITNWAKRVGLERSTMVRNINLLISKNLVESTAGHGKVFKLSQKGKEILSAATPIWEETQNKIENFLGKEDTETIKRIGDKLQYLSDM